MNSDNLEQFKAIPWPSSVTEIHVHLGGSVPLYRLWEIAIRRGIRGMGSGYDEFINIVKRQEGKVFDLESYLEIYDRIELIQSGPESVRESIIIAIHRALLTGGMIRLGPGGESQEPSPLFQIGRLEIRLNPLKRTGAVFLKGEHAGLYDVDRVIQAACSAVKEVEIGFKDKIQTGLLFCFGRDMTFEANMILAEKVRAWSEKEAPIVGVDLAGSEKANPLSTKKSREEMKQVFDAAGTGIGRTIHVGETPFIDIDTFVNTIEALEPQRVAHPIVAFRAYWEKKDDRGLKLLKERDLVCELCVKSNLLTGAVKSIKEYADVINTLDEFGIRYTFSTDAPSLQVTSLADELLLLFRESAISEEQILRALKTAEENSFLAPRSTDSN
jgi:adenosine deaminase